MPITVRGTSYDLPNSDGRTGPTGSEIDAVETHFGVDWYDLMETLDQSEKDEDGKPRPKPVYRPGCTRNRAVYAIAWIAMHRADPSVSLGDVMDEYARDEIRFTSETPTPGRKAKAAEVPTPAGDEEPEPAATS